jgi:hypothetical protein
MEAATPAAERSEHGLRKDAIGFVDGLIIGIASTARRGTGGGAV